MLRFVLAALLPIVLATPAAAASDAEEALLARMDDNHDGFVDDVELMRRLLFVFPRMDQNRDRLVSAQEYADWPRLAAAHGEPVLGHTPEQRARRFVQLDGNRDGALTFEEYREAALRRFAAGAR